MMSCSKERDKNLGDEKPESPYLYEISVVNAPHTLAGAQAADDSAEQPQLPDDPYKNEEILLPEFVVDQSNLYVSQKTKKSNPFQQHFQEQDAEESTPTYKYVYYYNPNADWEKGFNFKPADGNQIVQDDGSTVNGNALNWDDVGRFGSFGNGYSLFAMYYPVDNVPKLKVQTDQSTLENLMKSDIMGAYHSTSALYSRVRFRMFHLMVYLKVNLYVPVFRDDMTKGGKQQNSSGYLRGDLTKAEVVHSFTDIGMEWGAIRGSDTAPKVVSVYYKDDDSTGERERLDETSTTFLEDYLNLPDIQMYSHGRKSDTQDGATEPEPQPEPNPDQNTGDTGDTGDAGDTGDTGDGGDAGDTGDTGDGGDMGDGGDTGDGGIWPVKKMEHIKLSDFLTDEILKIQPMDPEQDNEYYDDVYVYSFSVIIPAPYSIFTEQKPGFLRFTFKMGDLPSKRYYFNGNFTKGNTNEGIALAQGNVQIMNLYLPRKGNEIILVEADVKEWSDVNTDMNLPKKDKDNGGNGNGNGNGGSDSGSN